MIENNEIIYYGWIPILTHTIRPVQKSYIEEKFKKVVLSDLYRSQEITISNYIWDNTGFLTGFTLSLFNADTIKINCKIKQSGLISFSFSTISGSKEALFLRNIAINIFNIIRDMYHEHVHHDKDDDGTLIPVIAVDDKDGIKKILDQYSDKIIQYHRAIRSYREFNILQRNYSLRNGLMLLESALGEFVYAQSFINHHKLQIDDYESVKESFEKASDSTTILREKFSWTLTWDVSIAIFILTAFLTIPTIFSVGWPVVKFILNSILGIDITSLLT